MPVQDLGRRPRSSSRWAHKGRWLVFLALLLLGGSALTLRVRARTRFDPAVAEGARQALDSARRSSGASWSPAALTLAETTYRRGMEELRRQQNRFFLFRDLRPPTDTLALVETRAAEAMQDGDRRRVGVRGEAVAVLDRLSEVLEMMDDLETRASLPREGRVGLASARMGFVEASALMEAGAYQEAQDRAERALAKARDVADVLGEAFLRFADAERVQTWRTWIDETVAWSRNNKAVALVVIKERNVLDVYREGRKVLSLSADMGSNNLAQKYRQGDQATPEGRYRVQQVKGRGQSIYYKAFLLDYPNAEDLRRIRAAKDAGIIPAGAGPGALVEIHGEGGRGQDWTNGCVAVTNANMDQLFQMVKVGTPVTIVGGDGSHGPFSSLAEQLRREP